MSFDFPTYLKQLDPLHSYSITKLTGGIVNVTVRAIKTSQHAVDVGRFPGHRSVILKYAPPFVAGVGPEATLTQTRQVTEATVLSLFDGSLKFIKRDSKMTVPGLLHHDSKSHIMVMSDLGHIPNLSEVFSVLGGYTPNIIPAALVEVKGRPDDIQYELHKHYYSILGTRLGTFFALLHSQQTLREVLKSTSAIGVELVNPELLESVHEFAIKPIESRLALFADLIPVSESASTLYGRISGDWLRPDSHNELSFVLGDCWTGAVLVSPPTHDEPEIDNADHRAGVIDWEFASIGRGPHGDVPQLLAHLELFRHAAVWRESAYHVCVLDSIITSLIQAYKAASYDSGGSKILADNENLTQKSKASPDPASQHARRIRSALLTHASEMLNCAFWKVWPCLESFCPALRSNKSAIEGGQTKPTEDDIEIPKRKRRPSFQTYSSPPLLRSEDIYLQQMYEQPIFYGPDKLHDEERLHLCPPVREMVKSAIWLICRAGKDEAEMCQDSNWGELIGGIPRPSEHASASKGVTFNHHVSGVTCEEERQIFVSSSFIADSGRNERLWLLDLFI